VISRFGIENQAGGAELFRGKACKRSRVSAEHAGKRKQLGRPRVEIDPLQVSGLRARGLSLNEIAGKLCVGRGTVERALKAASQKPSCKAATLSLT